MKILVTGGAGFIGSHLCEALLKNGHRVICLDNFNDFYAPSIKRNNAAALELHDSFELVEGDILDRSVLTQVFQKELDAVFHLAAYAGVRPSIQNPGLYQRVNVEGTVNLLDACVEFNIDKFIFASSSSVYGGRKKVPFKETDNIMHPISPYAATKVAGEALCYTYHHLHNINIHMHRFFTVYGPRQRPEMAIHLFARKILNGETIMLFGDGGSSRDYTYIDDIVAGLLSSLANCSGCDAFNLGGSKTVTLGKLVETIGAALAINPIVEYQPMQPGDVPITYADVSKAKRLLGYAPKTDIESGISKFCHWIKQQ